MKKYYASFGLNRGRLLACAVLTGLVSQVAWSGSISYNFAQNAGNQVLDTTTPKGPLNSPIWNDSTAEGVPANGTEGDLVDDGGNVTTASLAWTSANTWSGGSGTASENARILVGYLDDGNGGASVTLSDIPYDEYNVYGLLASGQDASAYTSMDFNVNGKWAFAVSEAQLTNAGSLGAAGNTTSNTGTIEPNGAIVGVEEPSYSVVAGEIIKVPYQAALNPAGAFTAEMWLKPSVENPEGTLTCAISSATASDPRSGWLIYQSATGWNFRTYNENGLASAVDITGGDPPVADTWYHVVVMWDGTVGKIYVNGSLSATSEPTSYLETLAGDFHFGSRSDGAFGWNGALDEVAFYDGNLDAGVIAAHYTNGVSADRTVAYPELIQASNPIGYWPGTTKESEASGTAPAYPNWQSAGEQWVRIDSTTDKRGNYWKISGLTGSTCTIQGQNRAGAQRGSLAAVIIEEVVVPDVLVNTGIVDYEEVALGSGLTSEFRPGLDLVTVEAPDGLSIAGPHSIEIELRPELESGTYKLIDYSGAIGADGFGGLSLVPATNPRFGLSLVHNVAESSIDVVYTAPDAIVWTAATDGTWDTDTTPNWVTGPGGPATNFLSNDAVSFDDSASTGNVMVSGGVTPLSLSFLNDSLDYTFSGDPISGNATLWKEGPGSLTFLNENEFVGEIVIVEGKIVVGDGVTGSLDPKAPILVAGAELELNSPSGDTFGNKVENEGFVTVSGLGDLTISGTIAGGSSSIDLKREGIVQMTGSGYEAGIIVASGTTLQAAGGGWVTSFFGNGSRSIIIEDMASLETTTHSLGGLGGALYQPSIVIEEGGLWAMLGEQYLTGDNLIIEGGTLEIAVNDLRLQGGTVLAASSSLGSLIQNGTITLHGDTAFSVDDGAADEDLLIDSDFAQSGEDRTLSKFGPGLMRMTGTASYLGATTVEEGPLMIDGELTASPITVLSGATLGGGGLTGGSLEVQVGGTFAPGDGVGAFGAGSAILAGDWQLEFDGGSDPGTDQLLLDGSLDATGGTLTFVATGSPLSGSSYVLAEYASITGTFAVTGLPAGYDLVYGANALLLVDPTKNPYLDWVTGEPYNLTGDDALPDSDPDKDGIANAIEFVIGGNPASVNDSDKLPTGESVGETFEFTYRRTDVSNYPPAPYTEYGSDLLGWTPAASGVDGVVITATDDFYGAGIDRVVVSYPKTLAEGLKLFVRLVANP